MAIFTYVGNKEASEKTARLKLRGGQLILELGKSADLTANEVAQLSNRYILVAGDVSTASPDLDSLQPVYYLNGQLRRLAPDGSSPVVPVESGVVLATAQRTTALTIDSPMLVPVDFDAPLTFTAPASGQVILAATVGYRLYQNGSTTVVLTAFVGPNTIVGQLSPVHQNDALTAGVQRIALAKSGSRAGTLAPPKLITGLTPGSVYRVELDITITGGGQYATVPGDPYFLAVSKGITPHTDASEVVAVKAGTTGIIHVFAYRGFLDTADLIKKTSATLTADQGGRLAVTPDGSRVVACQQTAGGGGGNVGVFTTGAPTVSGGVVNGGTWTAGAVSLYTPPGTNPFPIDVVCESNNTHAWILNNGTGTVVRMNLTDGTFGTPIATTLTSPQRVAISPDGLTLLVAGGGKVARIVIASSTVTTVTLASAVDVVYAPDGTAAYVVARPTATTGTLHRLTNVGMTGTLTLSAGVSLGVGPQALDIFPDGRSLLVFSDTSTLEQIRHHRTDDLSKYVSWNGTMTGAAGVSELYDGAIGPYGTIHASSADLDQLAQWPGGQFNFTPNSAYHNERIEAIVTAA